MRGALALTLLSMGGCTLDFDSLAGEGDGGVTSDGGAMDAPARDADVDAARPDARPPDGCVATAETCDGMDEDCDGLADEDPGTLCPGSQSCRRRECRAAEGSLAWERRIVGTGTEIVNGLTETAAGVAATGVWQSGAIFDDPDNGQAPGLADDLDLFVVTYQRDGDLADLLTAGSPLADRGQGMDWRSGDLFMTGSLAGAASVGGTGVPNGGASDLLVVRMDGRTSVQSAVTAGNAMIERGVDVAARRDGTVIVVGTVEGRVDYIPTLGVTMTDQEDIVILVLNSSGAILDGRLLTGARSDEATGVAVDAAGNVYVSGVFQTDLDVAGTPISTTRTGGVGFVARFAATDLSPNWVLPVEAPSRQTRVEAVDVTADGGVVVAGRFTSASLRIGGGPMLTNTLSPGADLWAARLSADRGEHTWSTSGGSVGSDRGRDVAVGPDGNVYLVGEMDAVATVGPTGVPVPNAGTSDAVVVGLNGLDGSVLWVANIGGVGADEAWAVAIDDELLYVAGQYGGDLTSPPGTRLVTVADPDGFVMALEY